MAIRELWRYKKLYSQGIYPAGSLAVANPVVINIELTKYAQEDFFSRLLLRVNGNVVVTTGGGGAATGKDNPEGLLVSVNQATTPQLNALNPVTNVSARGLLIDNTFMRGYIRRGTTIPDTTGSQPVDTLYEIYYKRPNGRRGIEWSHSIAKYSSDLLTLQFGGREQLFTGGTGTWDLSGLTLSIYSDSDFAVDADRIHNHELFERVFPILASQTDFPIDTLPQGYLYTDLIFLGEVNNALNATVLNNIDLEGGGRVWLPQGEQNAPVITKAIAEYRNVITDPSYAFTGIYPVILRDGMFTRSVDALTSPLSIKLDVTFQAGAQIRLIGRRMVPGVSKKSNPGAMGAKPVVTALPSR
jgi:hypothetical protein